jgi:hypothetical protein
LDNQKGESERRHWIVFDGDVDPGTFLQLRDYQSGPFAFFLLQQQSNNAIRNFLLRANVVDDKDIWYFVSDLDPPTNNLMQRGSGHDKDTFDLLEPPMQAKMQQSAS